jgi:hypothetical protein
LRGGDPRAPPLPYVRIAFFENRVVIAPPLMEEIMKYVKLSALLVCAAALGVTSSCSDMPAPLEPDGILLDVQAQQDGSSREVCWYVGSAHPDYNRHVVSWQDTFTERYGFRFGEPLPTNFFPANPPLVAHVISLFKFGSYNAEDRVGTGYMVSVTEPAGRNTYNMFHQVVLQPWMGPGAGDTAVRDWSYNEGLCEVQQLVPVCTLYKEEWQVGPDGHVECDKWVYRPACVGSFRGTSSISCNKLPCDSNLHRAQVTFDLGSWDGFGTLLDGGGIHHGREGELRAGSGDFAGHALLYGWHHGNLCVKTDGGVQPPGPDPELVAGFTYSCNNTRQCTFTDNSTGSIATANAWTFQNGDPGSFTGAGKPEVTYSSAGKHSVTLAVTDGTTTATANGEVSCTSHPRHGIRCN